MKKRIIALFLAVLFLLAGCAPKDVTNNQSEEPHNQDQQSQQDEQEDHNNQEQQGTMQPVQLDYDLGTIAANITNGRGLYAMANGFVYISEWNSSTILEYDTETGKIAEIPFPGGTPLSPTGEMHGNYRSWGNLFLLPSGIGIIEKSTITQRYKDVDGKTKWQNRSIQTLSILSYDGGKSISIPELGNYVTKVVPMKKLTADGKWEGSDADNPLAGLQLYCSIGYDTFPEMAEQLAQQGITLEEPTDINERNKYIVSSLVCMDGDTGEVTTLTQNFIGLFFVDEQYIYVLRHGETTTEYLLFRSSRDEIDFQQLDLGGDICNFITPYDGGVYFARAGSWNVCYYKDGEITGFPIVASDFVRCGDKIIYYANHWEDKSQENPVRSYNLNTGEIRDLCEDVAYDSFCVLGEKYVACRQVTETYEADLLIDLETGEQIEMHREEDEPDTRPAEVQQAIEKAKAEREKEQQAQQESTGE